VPNPISRNQQFILWVITAAVGLGIADALDASLWGSTGLVAAVGMLIGVGAAAWQRLSRSS